MSEAVAPVLGGAFAGAPPRGHRCAPTHRGRSDREGKRGGSWMAWPDSSNRSSPRPDGCGRTPAPAPPPRLNPGASPRGTLPVEVEVSSEFDLAPGRVELDRLHGQRARNRASTSSAGMPEAAPGAKLLGAKPRFGRPTPPAISSSSSKLAISAFGRLVRARGSAASAVRLPVPARSLVHLRVERRSVRPVRSASASGVGRARSGAGLTTLRVQRCAAAPSVGRFAPKLGGASAESRGLDFSRPGS